MNETAIEVQNLSHGDKFRRAGETTVYTCEGFPRTANGRTVVVYRVGGTRFEYNTVALATVYLVD